MSGARVLLPILGHVRRSSVQDRRLAESVRLAQSLGLRVAASDCVRVRKPRPATLFGPGFIERMHDSLAEDPAEPVIVDGALTPIQQRNLERAWECKVIDRKQLILEIFAARAQSREGKVQVEHAQLTYQKSRLVRSWTHLERQRGGVGFLGGPGETQIEADRRALATRLGKLDGELRRIAANRRVQRSGRQRSGMVSVALVGYTNAGKSTLFNRLCDSGSEARDQLFATLDPTVRCRRLPNGTPAAFSDTVGFIADLPTELVAAFRSTLLEATMARIVLHVIDASAAEWEEQRSVVTETLEAIGIRHGDGTEILEVFNKVDLLEPDTRRALVERRARTGEGVAISATGGEGVPALLRRIEQRVHADRAEYRISLAPEAGRALAWLHERGAVVPETVVPADGGSDRREVIASLSASDRDWLCGSFGRLVLDIRRRPGLAERTGQDNVT